MITPVTRVD